jgi:hypothetical protein
MKLCQSITTTIILSLIISICLNVEGKTIGDTEISESKILNDKALVAQGTGVRS